MRTGAGLAAVGVLGRYEPWLGRASAAGVRLPDSLPDPTRPAGVPTTALPFDHIVVVMQENHSFDNYFGMLPRRGQPAADGFRFDAAGVPLDSNPVDGGIVRVTHAPSLCQPNDVSQSWTATHKEVNGGRMDGFARLHEGQMLYYDRSDIPFYYSLANAFTIGNRWFSSAPCQTFPNRRFLLAGTAFGLISTDTASVSQKPPNGTVFDRLNAHGVSWKDYFVDVPATAVILDIVQRNLGNMAPIAAFFADCAAGTLPSVSFVDSEIGALNTAGGALAGLPIPLGNGVGDYTAAQNQDEENPANINVGEAFVKSVVDAVLSSPAWPRTLLVFMYDEHGGYYDHVPPPPAIAPDAIKPVLAPNDVPGGYDVYGPRVPAIVASPYSKPHGVTNVVHDHTSVLATIEAKWNLPALTYRDANATTLADFLDTSKPALLEPPMLAGAGDAARGTRNCVTTEPKLAVVPAPATIINTANGRLLVRFRGLHRRRHTAVVELHATKGTFSGLRVELRRHGHLVAHAQLARVAKRVRRVVLRRAHGRPFVAGQYTLVVRHGRTTLARRTVRVR